MGRIKKVEKVKGEANVRTRRSVVTDKFSQYCKCMFHSIFKDYLPSNRLCNLKSNEVRVKDKQKLLLMGYIKEHSSFVCAVCLT